MVSTSAFEAADLGSNPGAPAKKCNKKNKPSSAFWNDEGLFFVSKRPEKIHPHDNIIKVFDFKKHLI